MRVPVAADDRDRRRADAGDQIESGPPTRHRVHGAFEPHQRARRDGADRGRLRDKRQRQRAGSAAFPARSGRRSCRRRRRGPSRAARPSARVASALIAARVGASESAPAPAGEALCRVPRRRLCHGLRLAGRSTAPPDNATRVPQTAPSACARRPTRIRTTAARRLSYAIRPGTPSKCAKARTWPSRKLIWSWRS